MNFGWVGTIALALIGLATWTVVLTNSNSVSLVTIAGSTFTGSLKTAMTGK